MSNFSISQTTRNSVPRHPYEKIKDDILGKSYNLELNFIGSTLAKRLNQSYREKDYIPNVLSFPLAATTGEIFICPEAAKKEAAKFEMSADDYIGYLFIHGCLHLKGHHHGATMDKAEMKYCQKYQLR